MFTIKTSALIDGTPVFMLLDGNGWPASRTGGYFTTRESAQVACDVLNRIG